MARKFMSGCALLAAVLLAGGCKLPIGTRAATPEGVLHPNAQPDAGAVRLIKLTRADGQAVPDGTATVDGRQFQVKDGAIAVSETVFQEGQRLGNLLIMANGYAPVRLTAEAALAGVTLSPLQTLGSVTIDAAGGKLTSKDGAVAVYVPAGLLDGSSPLALGAYAPAGQDALAAAYQQDLGKLYRARGLAAPASGSCPTPLACLPIKSALGLSVNVDASVTGASGNFSVTLNLKEMLGGWDGKGTPPATWTDAQKQNALAAAQLLATFQALDASGDPTWRKGLNSSFGLSLDGDVLTMPVNADPTALAAGFTRVAVPGAELLGVRLEVTLTTKDVNSAFGIGPDGKPLDPGTLVIPTDIKESGVLDLPLPNLDASGATANAARAAVTLPGVTRAGSSLQSGLALAVTPPAGGAAAPSTVVPGNAGVVDPTLIAGQSDPNQLIANNSSGLIANNSSGIITNNGSQLFDDGAAAGLVASDGSQLVANNGSQLIGNNASGIVANNGGMLTGFPYLPVAPVLAKLQLLDIAVVTAPGVRRTAGGVIEYLWPDALNVRAIDVYGNPLTQWVTTDSRGAFQLPVKNTPQVFFLECTDSSGVYHVYSQVFAPGSKEALAAVDSSTTLMAISTVELYNFIPPEKARLSAIAAQFQSSASQTAKAAKNLPPRSPLFQLLAKRVQALQAGASVVDARIQELDNSWNAFAPANFGKDRVAAEPVVDQDLATQNAKSTSTEQIYNGLFDRSQAGQIQPRSLLPITLVSPI